MTKRIFSVFGLVFLLSGQMWAQQRVDLPRGTAIQVRLTERISSDRNKTGDRFQAILDQDLVDNGRVLARAGDPATGRLVRVQKDDDRGELIELTLTELRTGNQTYPLDTNNVIVRTKDSKGDNKDATIIGGGAGVGAVIGAIAGGLKGAIIGAAVGAGAGAAAVLITDDKHVQFDPEQKFRFYLDNDVRMVAQERSSDGTYSSNGTYSSSESNETYSTNDDRYGRGNNDQSGNNVGYTYDRQTIRQVADDLNQRAGHVWQMVKDQSDYLDSNRYSARESEDAIALYMALSNFANSAQQFRQFSDNSKASGGLRGGADSLIRQAENIDSMMASVNTFGHLQDDWRQVQDQVSRLASGFSLSYAPGSGSNQYRSE